MAEKSKFLRLMGAKDSKASMEQLSCSAESTTALCEKLQESQCHLHKKVKQGCKFCQRHAEAVTKLKEDKAVLHRTCTQSDQSLQQQRQRERDLESEYLDARRRNMRNQRAGLGAF